MVVPVKHFTLPDYYTPERRAWRIEKMKTRCELNETGCWEYHGSVTEHGYAQACIGTTRWMAHRLMYALVHGDLPPKLYVCHRCDNRKCVNPDHLFLGDHLANQQDKHRKGRCPQKAKKVCKFGHPFDDANTYFNSRGHRGCRTCQRISQRIRKAGWTREEAESTPVIPPGVKTKRRYSRLSQTERASES